MNKKKNEKKNLQSGTLRKSRMKSGRKSRGKTGRENGRRSGRLVTVLLILVMIAGVGIMVYPSFSNWYNEIHQSRAIADYNRIVSMNDSAENQRIWEEALAYNEDLARTGVNFRLYAYNTSQTGGGDLAAANGFDVSGDGNASGEGDVSDEGNAAEEATSAGTGGGDGGSDGSGGENGSAEEDLAAENERYESTLDVSGTGIMGYIDIDKLDIHLPIYHGSSEGVLQVAVGHIAGTSLPVGGSSSHCVLTGHTGLPSAKLFTDIDQLEIGDTFQIVVLDHTLTYQVNDIQVVLPSEVDSLAIQSGQDLCTLVTCTPYGINTHRLLVTGHRVDSGNGAVLSEENVRTIDPPDMSWIAEDRKITLQRILPYVIIGGVAVALIIIILVVHRMRRRDGRHPRR